MHQDIKSTERLISSSWSLFDQVERYRHISARYKTVVKRNSEDHQLLM
ncbi:hypothetical protein SAMN06296008_11618 [Polynucleobacter kasalickyi]|uniref:Uncharacterized protein n=1 Tax=Polynucleobacter kasalickyi TaxID=1938817 RepID=A0A1W2BWH5_9BURK|nr:hypothetical protein SAMN06296008_11618 [Polynucleobacter kasalickyi]